MPFTSVLPLVLAHANAGALSEARRLFREAGLDAERSDPAALAIRGRLIKDEARAADPAARAPLYAQAAEAYAAAGTLSGSTHHLINAASLWRLAGDGAASQAMARRVLDSLERHPEEPETPYWLGATRAEALLLLGRGDDARRALSEAMALAPRAYEDHAPTLRQFRLLLAEMGEDAAWLERHAPPRALHFAGHMAVAPDNAGLRRRVDEALAAERVGFGFGALAAGADIVVAEALLACGAELDLVLPASPEAFREASVSLAGEAWARRFDAVMAAGVSVRVAGARAGPPLGADLQLAAEVAMGLALMKGQALQTEALQLLVLDDADAAAGEPGGAGWARQVWAGAGRRQVVLPAARAGAPAPAAPADPQRRLAAWLAVAVEPERAPALAAALGEVREVIAPAAWSRDALLLAFASPAAAALAAEVARAALGPQARLAAHYASVLTIEAASLGGRLMVGAEVDLGRAILDSVPPGAWHASEAFAAALSTYGGGHRPVAVGELRDTPLFALT